MTENTIPNLFIVGAAKGGTTTVYRQLQKHPDIFLSDPKEPCFMAYHDADGRFEEHNHAITNLEEYEKLFVNSNHKYRGEATAIYLHLYENTIRNLLTYTDAENTRIIMFLRDPAERAYSQYLMHVRDLKEKLSFSEALEIEEKRKKEGCNVDFLYKERGFYYSQVKAFIDSFKHVKVFLYDDLQKNPQKVFDDIYDFLKISRLEIDTSERYNISGVPKSEGLMRIKNSFLYKDNMIKKMAKWLVPKKIRRNVSRGINESVNKLNTEKVQKPIDEINALRKLYIKEIEKLEVLISRDLSDWKL